MLGQRAQQSKENEFLPCSRQRWTLKEAPTTFPLWTGYCNRPEEVVLRKPDMNEHLPGTVLTILCKELNLIFQIAV